MAVQMKGKKKMSGMMMRVIIFFVIMMVLLLLPQNSLDADATKVIRYLKKKLAPLAFWKYNAKNRIQNLEKLRDEMEGLLFNGISFEDWKASLGSPISPTRSSYLSPFQPTSPSSPEGILIRRHVSKVKESDADLEGDADVSAATVEGEGRKLERQTIGCGMHDAKKLRAKINSIHHLNEVEDRLVGVRMTADEREKLEGLKETICEMIIFSAEELTKFYARISFPTKYAGSCLDGQESTAAERVGEGTARKLDEVVKARVDAVKKFQYETAIDAFDLNELEDGEKSGNLLKLLSQRYLLWHLKKITIPGPRQVDEFPETEKNLRRLRGADFMQRAILEPVWIALMIHKRDALSTKFAVTKFEEIQHEPMREIVIGGVQEKKFMISRDAKKRLEKRNFLVRNFAIRRFAMTKEENRAWKYYDVLLKILKDIGDYFHPSPAISGLIVVKESTQYNPQE